MYAFMYRSIKLLILLLGLCSIACIVSLIDTQPKIAAPSETTSSDYASISRIAKTLNHQIRQGHRRLKIDISQSELTSLSRVAAEQIGGFRSRATLSSQEMTIEMAYKLGDTGLWLNIDSSVSDGQDLALNYISIGAIRLPPKISNILLSRTLQEVTGKDSDDFNHYITSVNSTPRRLNVTATTPAQLAEKISDMIKNMSRFGGVDIETYDTKLRQYHQYFYTVSVSLEAKSRGHDLALYIEKLLMITTDNEDASVAMLALAMLVDSGYLESVLTANLQPQLADAPITLSGRKDLAKHFLLSAAIKLLSDQGTAISIGEAKELIDSNNGGSGFSFQDIAADRAGAKFAHHINKLVDWQELLHRQITITEYDFFPNVSDLQEGLNQDEFSMQYTSTQSDKYREVIENIDQRINNSVFYR